MFFTKKKKKKLKGANNFCCHQLYTPLPQMINKKKAYISSEKDWAQAIIRKEGLICYKTCYTSHKHDMDTGKWQILKE